VRPSWHSRHWEHVNLTDKPSGELPARSIRIAENRVAVGDKVETGSPKSRASRRVLPLPDDVLELLKAARKRQLAERLAFGEEYGEGDYVVVDGAGQPYNPAVLTWRWGAKLTT
jgi:integrase